MRVLLGVYSRSIADVTRALLVGGDLRSLGWSVHVGGGDGLGCHLSRRQGFPYHVLPEPTLAEARASAKSGMVFSESRLSDCIRGDEALLALVKPDAVVTSFRLSLFVSVRGASLPLVNLGFAYWLDEFYRITKVPPGIRDFLPGAVNAPKRLDDLGFNTSVFEPFLQGRGLAFGSLGSLLRADLNLIPDIPSLFPGLATELNNDASFIGPLTWQPEPDQDWDWNREQIRRLPRPLVAVTNGSTGDASKFFGLIRAMLSQGWGVVSYGRGMPNESLGQTHHPAAMLPGARVAALADCLVCHGGIGTVYQYLAAGRPIFVLPGDFEQFLNGHALWGCRAGALMAEGPGWLTESPDGLSAMEDLRAGAAQLGKALVSWQGGAKRAADRITGFLSAI